MGKHHSYSVEFKRQVAQEYLAGETLYGLAKRHQLSRNLIRVWVARYEAGGFDDDTVVADLMQAQDARIAAQRLVGKLTLENEFLKGASRAAPAPRSGCVNCRPPPLHRQEGRWASRADFTMTSLRARRSRRRGSPNASRRSCRVAGLRLPACHLQAEGRIVNHKKVMRLDAFRRQDRHETATTMARLPERGQGRDARRAGPALGRDITYIAIATSFVYLAAILDELVAAVVAMPFRRIDARSSLAALRQPSGLLVRHRPWLHSTPIAAPSTRDYRRVAAHGLRVNGPPRHIRGFMKTLKVEGST